VVVLVVVVPVVLGLVWLAISGMIVEPDPGMITVNFQSPSVTQRTIGEEVHYDATLNVNKITPKDERVRYTELRVIMKSASGSVLMTATQPRPHDPTRYDDGSLGLVGVQVWYVSVSGGTDLSAGDALVFSGMTTDYEGATIELTRAGERIGSITLPTDFS
jgi:hypothetical protein